MVKVSRRRFPYNMSFAMMKLLFTTTHPLPKYNPSPDVATKKLQAKGCLFPG